MWNNIRTRLAVIAALATGPAIYALAILRPRSMTDTYRASYDFYAYFYPNILHTIRSFQEGFGLFWNPYQNCGQPFFAFSLTALLHPPNIVFYLFDRETALLASIVLNLAIGGGGMWLLLREMRIAGTAAFAGAIAFQLSATSLTLSAWSPMHIGPYAWLPWALYAVERILREPTHRHGIVLALILAIQLLPGFPLASIFTVQLIALRIAWALAMREVERPSRLIVPLAIGLCAAPLLVAIQYVPSIQVAIDSVRAAGFNTEEIHESNTRFNRPGLAVMALAAASIFGRRHRKITIFYLAVGSCFGVLSLGNLTPAFYFYSALPLGDLFVRDPGRFLWLTTFSISVLLAIGVDQIARGNRRDGKVGRALVPITMCGVPLVLYAVPTWGPVPFEWVGAAAALILAGWVANRRPGHGAALNIMVVALAFSALHAQRHPYLNARTGPLYDTFEPEFTALRERMTPQDRVFIDLYAVKDFPLSKKVASIFRVPAISDYEPQTSRRFGEYTVRFRQGRQMEGLNDFLTYPVLSYEYNRKLMNLAAVRYLVARDQRRTVVFGRGWKEIMRSDEITIYENRRAEPRASFIPQISVVPRDQILKRLSQESFRPGRVAFVEEAPASGFLGSRGGRGSVSFIEDRGERVVLRAKAFKPGFVTLADQYLPGWIAKVNGEAVPILRANYVFRAVEVPAGESEIVFEYRPTPIYLGAVISLVSIFILTWIWHREARANP